MKLLAKKNSQDRRQERDRRRSQRSRAGGGRTAVIEITRNSLRVAVLTRSADGASDTIAASVHPWREEPSSIRSPLSRTELTEGFRKVAAAYNLQGAAIHIVLGGEFCVTRILRGPSEKVRAELKDLEQRSRLYLSLGPGDKALVSQVKPINARTTHALAVACQENTLQTIHEAAEAAGLQLQFIEPELTALGRAASRLANLPEGPYMVVLADDQRCELGVFHDGELLIDYRPGGRFGPQDLPTIIQQHFSRLERYASRFVAEGDTKIRRLYLAGEAQAVEQAQRLLAKKCPVEVEIVSPAQIQATWTLEEQARPFATATTLGGLLAAYYVAGQRDCPNLLEHLQARTRVPLRPILVRSLIPIAAVLLISAGLSALGAHQQHKVAALQAQVDGLSAAQARSTELRLKGMRSRAMLTQLELLAAQLPPTSSQKSVQLIANSMPDDVWLREFVLTDLEKLSLDGASYLEPDVYEFVRWLENAPGVREVALKGLTPGQSDAGPVSFFMLDVVFGEKSTPAPEVARRE